MFKLKIDFQTTLDLSSEFKGGTCLKRLIPFDKGRAIAFGWGINERVNGASYEYWIAELSPRGQVIRVLPRELTHRKDLLSSLNDDNQAQIFRFGERFGILLSTEIILLFSNISATPIVIPIQNHYSFLGQARHESNENDSYYVPTYCGYSNSDLIPVVLRHPKEHHNQVGRYLGLLRIDETSQCSIWENNDTDGAPRRTNLDDYRQFPIEGAHGGIHLVTKMGKTYRYQDLTPVISDCARLNNEWLVYAAAYNPTFIRYGIPLGTLTRNNDALAITELVVRPVEQCYSTICASLDRVIFSPLRANGDRKGKQSIFTLDDEIDHPISFPRGFTKYHVQEYVDRRYWLTSNDLGSMPMQIAICVEAL